VTTARIQPLRLAVLCMPALALTAALAIVPGRMVHASAQPPATKPTIVLVHGAWADARAGRL